MAKYRILEYNNLGSIFYVVQKKIFFIFWYNFENIDGYTTGVYDTLEDALKAVERNRSKPTKSIIKI